MPARRRVACVYPVRLVAPGGLVVQAANAIAGLSDPRIDLHAIGPALIEWPREGTAPAATWRVVADARALWAGWPGVRSLSGALQSAHESSLGRAAAAHLDAARPDIVYAFTLVGLESLRWARARGVPSIVESPNGHIRDFRSVYVDEHARWCGGTYRGHPTASMVDRVEEEYALADRIRVSSEWAKASLVSGGVPAEKVTVLQQPVNLERYRPVARPGGTTGPLRVVFVGTLDLRKGFVYLLDAVRARADRVSLHMVGGTVDRCTRRLVAEHSRDVPVTIAPADPRPAYHAAEVAVVPSLEDGSPFAAAEAMSCGLPLLTTDACGAREWVQQGVTGWVVAARSAGAIARALDVAMASRGRLAGMGAAARHATEARADGVRCDVALADWVLASAAQGA